MNARSINISFIKSRLDGFKLNTEDGSDLSALVREINVRGEEESFWEVEAESQQSVESAKRNFCHKYSTKQQSVAVCYHASK